MSLKKFGRKLKIALVVRGLSQEDTTKALGLTTSSLQWWVEGRNGPSPSNMTNLLKFLTKTPILPHIPHYPYFYIQETDIPSKKAR